MSSFFRYYYKVDKINLVNNYSEKFLKIGIYIVKNFIDRANLKF